MKYDFTSILDRRGMDAIAVDGLGREMAPGAPKPGFDPIPMWVADMNFPTVPTVPQALVARAAHPAYGYFAPPEAYWDSIIRWHETRNGVTGLTAQCIGYQNSVLGGVVSALNVLCSKGDSILIHSPTYVGFTSALNNNGYNAVHSELIRDENGIWRMDYEDMEEKLARHRIHTLLFCSPHNPCGRVWERWELEKMMAICEQYDVYVVSDEIWSDLILPGFRHIPTQMVSRDARNRTIAMYAPSKTFNLAGLVGSYHIIYNQRLRDRVEKEGSLSHYNERNLLSMHALMAAYRHEGQEWVDELMTVIAGNIDFACGHIEKHYPGVKVSRPQGTYMLFLDCTDWCAARGWSIDRLLRAGWDVGVAWQSGAMFRGPCHIRMNLALPLSRVQEAFRRLDEYVFRIA